MSSVFRKDPACIDANVAGADADYNDHSPTSSEAALFGKIEQLARCMEELWDGFSEMHQSCDPKG